MGHILTMEPEITMTIDDMRYDFVQDVSIKNEVFSLAIDPTLKLAAGVWTEAVDDSLETARLNCLHCSLGKLKAIWPDWVFYLLACHRTIQPDNRITRHRGLWKSLVAGGAELPKGEFSKESFLTAEGGMRAFGAVRFEFDQIKAVHSIIQLTQAAIIFTSESSALAKVPTLVARGWATTNTKPPEEIVEIICDQWGITIDAYGEFDDRDACVAAIGRRDVVESLSP